MNNVFVYCEMEGKHVADVSLELLTKGRKLATQLGCQLETICAGTDLADVEKQVLPYGVDRVHVFDAPGLFPYTSLPHTSILVNLFKEEKPQICLMGATVIGRDLGPRVSSALTSGLTADCTQLEIGNHEDKKNGITYEDLIYPSLWLQEHYGKTIADLDHVVQSDSHSTSLARLATGQADVMVSYGHIRIKNAPIWQEKLGGTAPMVEQTGIIGVTEGIYNDMIAYSKNSDLMADEDFRKALGEAFIEIAQTDEGKEIISVFSQVGYTWGKDSDYDGERDAQAMLKSAGK